MATEDQVEKLCKDLNSVIQKYLRHELPGQEKRVFAPAHAGEAKKLQMMLKIIMKDKKGLYPNPDDKLNVIDRVLKDFIKPDEINKKKYVGLQEVKATYKGGMNLARSLNEVVNDFERLNKTAQVRGQNR